MLGNASWDDADHELTLKQISSSVKSQDVSHLLGTLFKDTLSGTSFNTEIIENQVKSKGSDDPYHERYVAELQKLLHEKEKRMANFSNLERHIIQAQAKVLSANEKILNRYHSAGIYKDITTPNVNYPIHSNLDLKMLQENGLLTLEDFGIRKNTSVEAPKVLWQGGRFPPRVPIRKTKEEHKYENQSSITYSHSEKTMRNQEDKQKPKKDDLIFPSPNAWKELSSLSERQKEKRIMARMESKANFLRNPRHQNPEILSGVISLVQHKKSLTDQNTVLETDKDQTLTIFLPNPKEIIFSDYMTGNIYEAILELKNISTVLRPCRVLPPASKYFTLGLGQFPDDHGLVAPGMSCLYTIRFAPDSLGDFIDELKIMTQSSNPLIVPLLGKRPNPILTLPNTIDLGYSLVGSIQVTQVVLKNNGGAGCFCLLPSSTWPKTNFRNVVHEEIVSIPPFVIRPSTFEMKSDQVGVLEFVFKPKEVKTYREKVLVVCDNCQVKEIEIIGVSQKAEVALIPCEDVFTESVDSPDRQEKNFIRFEKLNPFTYQEKNFRVKNCTNINLPFYWLKYKLTKNPQNQDSSDTYLKVMAGTPPFCVYPTYGTLSALETLYFETVFAPEKVDSYRCVLQMILENVPDMGTTPVKKVNPVDEPVGKHLEIINKNEYVCLCIEMQGICIPFSVMLRPYAMFIHGQIYCGITEKRKFTLINNSISPIKFKWETWNSELFEMEVVPSTGAIDPSNEIELELCLTGLQPGPINHNLKFLLEYQEEAVFYNIQANVKGADIVVLEPSVDFGLIFRGNATSKEITLHNESPIPGEFSIMEDLTNSEAGISELIFSPENGTIEPLQSCKVTITYNAEKAAIFKKYMLVKSQSGQCSKTLIYGEVQNSNVVLKSCRLYMEKLYHNVRGRYKVVLVNNTLLPTEYEWQEPYGIQTNFCDVQIFPDSGCIGPRLEEDFELIFTPFKKVLFHDIYLSCKIQGMENELCLSMIGDVLGVEIEYKISQEKTLATEQYKETEKLLDFGDAVQINSLSHVYVYIYNKSAINTTFSAYIEHFPARQPEPIPKSASSRSGKFNSSSSKDSTSKKATSAAKRFIKTIDEELKNSYLRDNNGIAFLITPANGSLPAHGSTVIQVTAFNNMWGRYLDTFCCKVGDLDMDKIPMQINVCGPPLRFLMLRPNSDQSLKLRFGTLTAGHHPIDRRLRICNTSPFDIRVDWLCYNVYEEDEQLLDFIPVYGDAFPILGEDGLEICPPAPEGSSPKENVDIYDFIKTILTIHNGIESNKPFSIIPHQVVLPANSNTSVIVRFTPPLGQEVLNEYDCISFAYGYLNLWNPPKNEHSSRIFRAQGYDIPPLTIHMTARILPAQLFIDFMGEEKLHFQCGLGELLEDNKLCEEKLKITSLKFINQTQTQMKFILLSQNPFLFMNFQSTSSDKANEGSPSTSFTLHPQKHLTVKVGFILSKNILNYRQMLEADEAESIDGISLKNIEMETFMHFKKALKVEFDNKMTQPVTVEATISLPNFKVSTTNIEFGICWIGEEKWEEFVLTNTSESKTLFYINIGSFCSCCNSSVFRVEPSSGYLDGHVSHTDNYWRKIRVFFAAKTVGGHKAELTISGIMGEKKVSIYFRGLGSHDGRHCSVTES